MFDAEKIRKLNPYDRLRYWITEREKIRFAKNEDHPKPWSDDPIFQTCYFCNVHREHDKVTKWVFKNILRKLPKDPRVVFAVIAFRWFNYIPTGDRLGNYLTKWDLQKVIRLLESIDGQVFTGAFNISNSGSTKPKINRVCEDYIQPVWDDRVKLVEALTEATTLQQAHKILMKYPGLGGSGFMAAQVIADLKHTYVLVDTEDWWTWASPGPGSLRGMNRLEGLQPNAPRRPGWLERLQKWRVRLNKDLEGVADLCGQNTQNCLCEYDKYCRVLFNEGRSKRTYPGV